MEEAVLKRFAEKVDKEKVQKFYEKALDILTSCLDELRKTTSSNNTLDYDSTRIFPMGDYTNDTFIDESGELEIMIATSNPQIILANDIYIKNLKNAKSKKEKNLVSKSGTFDEIIFNFGNILVKHFDDSTTILATNQGIKILCLKEYDFKLLIRFSTYNSDDENAILNIWDPLLNVQNKVNLFSYNEKMEEKDKQTLGNYKKLVRIYKNIRKTILINKWAYSNDLNKYFIELIVYNIPNSIMQDKDIKMLFVKSMNYLLNCNVLNFVDFSGNNIENFDMAKVTFIKTKNFINYASKIAF